jgi:Outer membrane efflux protein
LELEIPFGEMEFGLRQFEAQPWKNVPDAKDKRNLQGALFREVRKPFDQIAGEMVRERLEMIRPTWPGLAPVIVEGVDVLEGDLELAYDVVTRTALANRLDLMNERARVNDAWRQVAIFANSLLGTFNVGYHMDSQTPPGQAKPLAFSSSRTRHQLFFNGELPLVRLAERNAYRASLIAFQRARRTLMAAEDNVAAQVREELRLLRFLAQNFRIQQRSVELAYTQVESALETFRAPPQPGVGGNQASVTTFTQQLLQAQANLPQVQNQLYQVWIDYQVARQQLFLDIEVMPLDFRGVWIDEHTYRRDEPVPAESQDGLLPVLSPAGERGPTGARVPERGAPDLAPPRLLPPAEVFPAMVP